MLKKERRHTIEVRSFLGMHLLKSLMDLIRHKLLQQSPVHVWGDFRLDSFQDFSKLRRCNGSEKFGVVVHEHLLHYYLILLPYLLRVEDTLNGVFLLPR